MIKINRWKHKDCSIGRLTIGGFQCFTLELADKDNQKNISCIPEGTYKYKFYDSPKHGTVLHIQDVPNRTMIEIHAGNYTSQIEGCILVGDSVKFLNNDNIPDITNSKRTLRKILALASNYSEIQITSRD